MKKILSLIFCMLFLFTILSNIGIAKIDNFLTQDVSYDKPEHPIHNIFIDDDCPDIYAHFPVQYGDTIDQYMIEPTNFGWMVCIIQWIAQGFTPNVSIMTRVEIELFKIGNPPSNTQIYIGLFDGLLDTELAYTIYTADQFTSSRQWLTLELDYLTVEPGKKYYIVCLTDYFSYYDGFYWFAVNDNPYSRGDAWGSFLGYEWFLLDVPPDNPQTDCTFKTYGIDKTKMKWTFFRGSFSNKSDVQDYTVLQSQNLIGFQMFPFNRVQYTDDEKVTILKNGLGIITNDRIFGFFRAHI